MDRLSALDTVFLMLESDIAPLHVGSVLILDGPPPPFADLRAHVLARLRAMPAHRLRVRSAPLGLVRPAWVRDDGFIVDDHLGRVTLDEPGDEKALRDLVVRVMAERLALDRPPWQMWLVEGLDRDRWALIVKAHHAMVDGVAGEDLVRCLLSASPEVLEPGAAAREAAIPPVRASASRLPSQSGGGFLGLPFRIGRVLGETARSPSSPREWWGRVRCGAAAVAQPDLSQSLLNGPVAGGRTWGWVAGDLKAVHDAARAHACTVNDVFLAVVTDALVAYLDGCGEPLAGLELRALVPVSRAQGARERGRRNRVSAVFVRLPADVPDPVERLAVIASRTFEQKAGGVAEGTDAVLHLADHVPAPLLSMAARSYARMGQRRVNVVASNVEGPSQHLFLAGSRVLMMLPFIPVAVDVRVGFSLLTYDGRFTISITGDSDSCPDLDRLLEATRESLCSRALSPLV